MHEYAELLQVLEKVIHNIKNLPTGIEKAVEFHVIMPILQALHWDCFDPQIVKPQYQIGNGRVDFALLYNGKPWVFIEAKSLGTKLDEFHAQTIFYAFQGEAEIAVLTNGESWFFYLPRERGNWQERQFLRVNLYDQNIEDIEKNFMCFLSFESITSGESVRRAKDRLIEKQRKKKISVTLHKAFEDILAEPDNRFFDILAEKCENLCQFRPTVNESKLFLKEILEKLISIGMDTSESGKSEKKHAYKTKSKNSETIMQILDVITQIFERGKNYNEASKIVALNRRVKVNTIYDKCTRRIGLKKAGFEELIQKKDKLLFFLVEKFPLDKDLIVKRLGG